MKKFKKSFPRGLAKFIRGEKSKIRRLFQDPKEQENRIKAIYDHFSVFLKNNKV